VSSEFRDPSEPFQESPRLAAELIAHALGADARVLDFVARFAQAWDGLGTITFSASEQRALWALSGREELPPARWDELTAHARRSLLVAARRALELARGCAWIFGEGGGPRS